MFWPAIRPFTASRTRQPSRASFSAKPRPTQSLRQSATTTELPTLTSPFSTCHASTTWACSTPSISGQRGLAPVATTTASGASFSTSVASTGVFFTTSTRASSISRVRLVTMPAGSLRS